MSALDIRPIAASLGAEIHGVDLNDLSDNQLEQIQDAWAEHLVLFFPNQSLTPDGHRSFAANFGELEVVDGLPKVDEETHPEIVVLDNANTPTADVWHTDVTFSPEPPIGSILHMVECPPVGGDTMWINLHRAYETLSAPMQELLEGLTAIHRSSYGPGKAEHPVVRIHPVTGRKSLYVNRIFTKRIVQMSAPEGENLLRFLYRWSEQPSFSVRYRWTPGAVGMWDNRATLHAVVNDWQGHRVIQRITVLGDKPTGVGEPRWAKFEASSNGASDYFDLAYPF